MTRLYNCQIIAPRPCEPVAIIGVAKLPIHDLPPAPFDGESIATTGERRNSECSLGKLRKYKYVSVTFPAPYEPGLDQMGQHAIAEDDQEERRPVRARQRNKTEHRTEWGIREECASTRHQDRRYDQRVARAALHERDLRRADDVNDQGLRQQ